MQPHEPLITTIIPTYRRPALLRRAIRSVLNQTYSNVQVCVYDNASGDETAEVVSEIAASDERVKYHCHRDNIGSIPNFNYGLAQVNTPFFSVLSDDDVLLPDFFHHALAGFEKFPNAVFSAGSVLTVNNDGQVLIATLDTWEREGYFTPPEGVYEMMKGNHPIITGILFRKEIIDIFGGLDPEVIASDLDLELRIAARYPYVISRAPSALFVCHPGSAGMLTDTSWIWPSCQKMVRNLKEDPGIKKDLKVVIENALDKYFANTIFIIGLRSSIRGNTSDGNKAALVLQTQFGAYFRPVVLKLITTVFDRIELAQQAATSVYKLLPVIYRLRKRRLQNKYAYLAKYLEM